MTTLQKKTGATRSPRNRVKVGTTWWGRSIMDVKFNNPHSLIMQVTPTKQKVIGMVKPLKGGGYQTYYGTRFRDIGIYPKRATAERVLLKLYRAKARK